MRTFAIFQQIGWPEILLMLGVAVLIFGPKKLPQIGRSLGKGIREFRTGVKGLGDDVREGMEDDEKPSASSKDAGSSDKGDGR
ncbi:MAG: Sec-independent protein translocase subunit TatA/TatB [Actinomycetota bacterium]